MKNKDSVSMKSLKNNGAVTFTTAKELQVLLQECSQQGFKVAIRKFSSFVSVVALR